PIPSWIPISRSRWDDLKHRILGDPVRYSFQRRYLAEVGGIGATHPINWGWRAAGGVSPLGLARGILTAFDAFSSGRTSGSIWVRIAQRMNVVGLHEHRPTGT